MKVTHSQKNRNSNPNPKVIGKIPLAIKDRILANDVNIIVANQQYAASSTKW